MTHSKAIVKDIKTQLAIPNAVTVSESFDRPNIFYTVRGSPIFHPQVVNTDNVDKFDHLKRLLREHVNQSVIIYGKSSPLL